MIKDAVGFEDRIKLAIITTDSRSYVSNFFRL